MVNQIVIYQTYLLPIFVSPNNWEDMKSKEFHRLVQSEGWRKVRQVGSHIIYEKNGNKFVIPFHNSKEIKKGLVEKPKKEMDL